MPSLTLTIKATVEKRPDGFHYVLEVFSDETRKDERWHEFFCEGPYANEFLAREDLQGAKAEVTRRLIQSGHNLKEHDFRKGA